MPFKQEAIASHAKYGEQFKKELAKLKAGGDGLKVEFWFYDEVDLGGTTGPVLVFDDVQTSVLNTLKGKAKSRARGSCFLEGSALKLSLTKGKMPAPKVKPLFQGIPYTFRIVDIDGLEDGDGAAPSEAETALFAELNPLSDRYDVLVGQLGDKLPGTIRAAADTALEEISREATKGNFEEALKLARAFRRQVDDIAELAGKGVGTDPGALAKAREALVRRFDAVKGGLPDDERRALHGLFGAFDDVAGDPDKARKALLDLRDAVEQAEKAGGTPRQKLEAEAKKILQSVAKAKDRLSPSDGKKIATLVQELKTALEKPGMDEPARILSLLQMTIEDALVAPGDQRSQDRGDADTAQKALREAMAAFDGIKAKITDDARKELRVAFGQAADRMKGGKFAETQVLAAAIVRRIGVLAKALETGAAQPDIEVLSDKDARQAVLLQRRVKEVTTRLAGLKKGKAVTDKAAQDLAKRIEAVTKLVEEGNVDTAATRLTGIETELGNARRSLLRRVETEENNALQALETSATQDERDLASEILSISEEIETAFEWIVDVNTDLSLYRADMAQPGLTQQEAEDIANEIDALLDELDDARKELAACRKKLNDKIQQLKQTEKQKHPQLVRTLQLAHERFVAAEEAAGEVSESEARADLSRLVKRMAEATTWREQQLKGAGHGTSRHGAQTGLGRQARRAASDSAVTPDQTDNPSGAPQMLSWNKVQFTYTEQDGKRVVAKRKMVATRLAGVAMAGGPQTSKGSMWATPVLEKLAYDTALKHANAMKAYTHYIKANGQRNEFLKFTAHVAAPGGQPGWGFSIERTSNTIDDATADAILQDFENGRLTHDEMYREMGVKLAGKGASGEYIRYATVVFTRTAPGAAWNLLTMYPNGDKTSQYWECQKNWAPNNLRFDTGPGTAQQAIANTTMP
jgi:hypothetical protein